VHRGYSLTLFLNKKPGRFQEKNMIRRTPLDRLHQNSGFSLIEALIVMALMAAVSGIALLGVNGIVPGMRTNEAMYKTLAQLRRGRESAMAQRRNIEVRFLEKNQIQLVRNEVPSGTTILSTVELTNKCEFLLFAGVPDSPDAFGNTTAVDFGASGTLTFLSDGTLVDTVGNPRNGSVFLGLPNKPETARVVTILGSTGRVRSYRWTGTSWIN
jgi:prepilin-type N-terminal cleavage/methylation domain-containing protein